MVLLTIGVGLPEQKIRKRIIPIAGTSEAEIRSAAIAIFSLLHPHRGEADTDGVVSVLNRKIVEDGFADVALVIRCTAIAQASVSIDAGVRSAAVWICEGGVVSEFASERR